jgi:hypothetical protein
MPWEMYYDMGNSRFLDSSKRTDTMPLFRNFTSNSYISAVELRNRSEDSIYFKYTPNVNHLSFFRQL